MDSNNNWVDFVVTRGPIRGEIRSKVGLVIKIKARRDVEDFMSNLAEGRRMLVEAVSDSWINCKSGAGPLEYYDAAIQASRNYTFAAIGQGLIINNDGAAPARRVLAVAAEEQINLSFLLLAGISNPDGVTIGLSGAYSSDYVNKIKSSLPAAIKQFLQDYLVPMTVNLHIIASGYKGE